MKKTFLVVLCVLLCIATVCLFAACQKTPDNTEESATPDANTPAASATPEATPEVTTDTTPDATEEPTVAPTEAPTQAPTVAPTPTPTPKPAGLEGTVAHWKFQNDSKYFSGSLNGSDLKFNDLTGNGNTLEVKVEGAGDKFNVFSWDNGSNLGSQGNSSLNFANTSANAKAVCPSEYKGKNMDYTGGTYVSGK